MAKAVEAAKRTGAATTHTARETMVTTDEFAKALAALVVQAKEAGIEESELIAELRRQADAMQQRLDG